MIPIVFNAQNCYLIEDLLNWSGGLELSAEIPTSYERGLTGRETRRPTGSTLRISCKFRSLLTNSIAITNLRNSLQGLGVQPVLCPLWPAGFAAGSAPTVTAAWYVLIDSSAAPSIQPSSALPFARTAYPLMVGIFKQDPEIELLDGLTGSVNYNFTEDGKFPLTFPTPATVDGLNTAGGVRPMFPFIPNWSTVPISGGSEQDIQRKKIGEQRAMASAYFTQPGRRKTKQLFTMQGAAPLNLFGFFASMGGEQNNFWLGAALNEAALVADIAPADTAVTVDNGAALGTNAFIVLRQGNLSVPLAVTSVAGNTWDLSGAVGSAFTAGLTRIESLVLARFDLLNLVITFRSPVLAVSTVGFKELPWETNAVAGETYGTTMGALPITASFFKFTMTSPTATTTWYFTSYESDLSDGANDWLAAPIEYDSINETADLKRNETNITSRNFANNPLSLLFPLSLEWPLMVEISEGDIDAGAGTVSNLRKYFYGEVGSAEMEPPFITAKCATLSHIFDRQIPRRLYQPTDNWCLFEPSNGLNPADWKWTAVTVSYSAALGQLIIGTIASTNPAALTQHYFAAGYLVLTSVATGLQQVRMVADSTAIGGGQITLSLSTPFNVAAVAGDTLSLYPGYDGQATTAENKFNNYQQKFGGFPFMPVGNPSVLRITQPTGGAGKK